MGSTIKSPRKLHKQLPNKSVGGVNLHGFILQQLWEGWGLNLSFSQKSSKHMGSAMHQFLSYFRNGSEKGW